MTIPELIDVAERDSPFYRNSGGGVTLSGGEPAAQPKFVIELLSELRNRGIHTAIETSGFAEWDIFEPIAERSDLILFDLKHMDPEIHERYVGVPNKKVLSNLKKLTQLRKSVILRIPVIPTVNDSIENMVKTANFIRGLGGSVEEVDLLPYHRLGVMKYQRLGKTYPVNGMDPPNSGKMEEIAGLFQAYDLKVKIGG